MLTSWRTLERNTRSLTALFAKSNQIYFLELRSLRITSLTYLWLYLHIKPRHKKTVCARNSYTSLPSFLIILFFGIWHIRFGGFRPPLQECLLFCYFLYYYQFFKSFFIIIFLANMNLIFNFSIEPYLF